MLATLSFLALIWLIGRLLNAPGKLMAAILGIAIAFVLTVQFTLPSAHVFRQITGSNPTAWASLIGAAALAILYWQGLRFLKSRSATRNPAMAEPDPRMPARPDKMTDAEIERYSRHIVLREIGGAGQKKLHEAKVLIIGAGGLGSPVVLYLSAGGVGTIGIVDDDAVCLSNLQRQIAHDDRRIGMAKVFSAQTAVAGINPNVAVLPYNRKLDAENAPDLIAAFDLVIDGCDDAATRRVINAECVRQEKPLISGALSQWEGQVAVFDPASDGPCYACVFPKDAAPGAAPTCAEGGVLNALPGVIGAMMAAEAIKEITGAGRVLRGEMLIYDALFGENRKISVKKDPKCPVCGTN